MTMSNKGLFRAFVTSDYAIPPIMGELRITPLVIMLVALHTDRV